MTEDEFWLGLEWRICRELRGMNDRKLRSMWCDGIRGDMVRPEAGPAYMSGTIWIGKDGQTAMQFMMALADNVVDEDGIAWSKLMPSEDVTAWLSVDPKRKLVMIDLSKAEPVAEMTETYSVRLVGGEDGERATFEFDDDRDPCLLVCRYRGKTISSQESDFFEALASIRRRLQAEDLMPYCYGASLNVFPSGMVRDMGRGLKAYKMTLGKHVSNVDLVGIFDEGIDVAPADVDAQEQFFRDWLASPRT